MTDELVLKQSQKINQLCKEILDESMKNEELTAEAKHLHDRVKYWMRITDHWCAQYQILQEELNKARGAR